MWIQVTYTNGETEDKKVRRWVKDKNGVTWFLMFDNLWAHSFCVRYVREYPNIRMKGIKP